MQLPGAKVSDAYHRAGRLANNDVGIGTKAARESGMRTASDDQQVSFLPTGETAHGAWDIAGQYGDLRFDADALLDALDLCFCFGEQLLFRTIRKGAVLDGLRNHMNNLEIRAKFGRQLFGPTYVGQLCEPRSRAQTTLRSAMSSSFGTCSMWTPVQTGHEASCRTLAVTDPKMSLRKVP